MRFLAEGARRRGPVAVTSSPSGSSWTSRAVRAMTKGNKQKVGLVQAFMHHPEVLILDEPTSGLDPLMQQEFLEIVREARAAGQTVFMSSHVLAEVQQAADRVAIVRDGRLAAVERVESLGKRAVRDVEIHFDEPVGARTSAACRASPT